jgi:Raf kinase inhibitor-like YbhB/YbcL family protein
VKLTCETFRDGAPIPARHATRAVPGGANESFPLHWEGAPRETRSFALSVVDPHPVARDWVHWLVVDIPAGTRSLVSKGSTVSLPAGARELRNSFGKIGYGGPQPPPGTGPHPYVITLHALDADRMEVGEDVSLEEFRRAIRPHLLAEAAITGFFER